MGSETVSAGTLGTKPVTKSVTSPVTPPSGHQLYGGGQLTAASRSLPIQTRPNQRARRQLRCRMHANGPLEPAGSFPFRLAPSEGREDLLRTKAKEMAIAASCLGTKDACVFTVDTRNRFYSSQYPSVSEPLRVELKCVGN